MDITKKLFEYQDKTYIDFIAKLCPGVPYESFIGVRNPDVKKVAKEAIKDPEYINFINSLPHQYYEENQTHGAIISLMKDYTECIDAVDKFLPYVDNWAVCDSMNPKCFAKHKNELIEKVKEWIVSDKVYTCRFGVDVLMGHFLDDNFKPEYLKLVSKIRSDEYYIKMVVAWYFATALAKQWDATIPYIEKGKLDTWVHNKTIQKAKESYRITEEQKTYLTTLKKANKK